MDETSILLSRFNELQHLLRSPGGEQQGPRVDALAMFIARRAPDPSIRKIAMRVLAEAAKLRRGDHAQDADRLNALLELLRVAITERSSPSSSTFS